MSGQLWVQLTARAAALGEQAAAQRRRMLADELAGVPGVSAVIEGDGVMLNGRGLMRRLADDARLRFAGRSGR